MYPRFVADNDFDERIRKGLLRKEPAIESFSAVDGGTVGVPDPEVLSLAAEGGLIVVSHDRNTMAAHFDRFIRSRSSPGLLIVSQGLDIGDAIEELLFLWAASDAKEFLNRRRFVPLATAATESCAPPPSWRKRLDLSRGLPGACARTRYSAVPDMRRHPPVRQIIFDGSVDLVQAQGRERFRDSDGDSPRR